MSNGYINVAIEVWTEFALWVRDRKATGEIDGRGSTFWWYRKRKALSGMSPREAMYSDPELVLKLVKEDRRVGKNP